MTLQIDSPVLFVKSFMCKEISTVVQMLEQRRSLKLK